MKSLCGGPLCDGYQARCEICNPACGPDEPPDISRAGLRAKDGLELTTERKAALAKRVLELYDNGVTDPDRLRLEVNGRQSLGVEPSDSGGITKPRQ